MGWVWATSNKDNTSMTTRRMCEADEDMNGQKDFFLSSVSWMMMTIMEVWLVLGLCIGVKDISPPLWKSWTPVDKIMRKVKIVLPADIVSSGLSSRRRTVWTPSSVTIRWVLFRKLDLLLELFCFFTCLVDENLTSDDFMCFHLVWVAWSFLLLTIWCCYPGAAKAWNRLVIARSESAALLVIIKHLLWAEVHLGRLINLKCCLCFVITIALHPQDPNDHTSSQG